MGRIVFIIVLLTSQLCAQDSNFFNDGENESAAYQSDIPKVEIDTLLSNGINIVIHNSKEDHIMMDLIVLYRNDTLFKGNMVRTSIGIESDYIYDENDLPKAIITDVNNNGIDDVVISIHTGGAHCCHVMKIYEVINSQVKVVFDGAEKDMGEYLLSDIDDDGIQEIITHDDAFAYFDGGYAYSPSIQVVYKWTGSRYQTKLIKESWETDNEYFKSMDSDLYLKGLDGSADDIFYADFWCESEKERHRSLAPPELWWKVCSLIEIGRCDLIDAFIRRSWGGTDKEMNEAVDHFKKEIKTSRYIEYYKSICKDWI